MDLEPSFITPVRQSHLPSNTPGKHNTLTLTPTLTTPSLNTLTSLPLSSTTTSSSSQIPSPNRLNSAACRVKSTVTLRSRGISSRSTAKRPEAEGWQTAQRESSGARSVQAMLVLKLERWRWRIWGSERGVWRRGSVWVQKSGEWGWLVREPGTCWGTIVWKRSLVYPFLSAHSTGSEENDASFHIYAQPPHLRSPIRAQRRSGTGGRRSTYHSA